jgi:YD repeat-containing protein
VHYLPGGDRSLDDDYDRFGNRKRLTLNDGSPLVHDYVYDKLNRLQAATLPGGQGFGLTYFANDDLKRLTYPNGVTTDYRYDPRGPIDDITVNGTAGLLAHDAYTHDDALNIATLTDPDGAHAYDYDGIDRLIEATHPAPSGLPGTESFGYDRVGNRADPTTLVLGAAYSLWLVKRVVFGPVANEGVRRLEDVNAREFVILASLAVAVLLFGIWPAPLVEVMHASIDNLIVQVATSKLPETGLAFINAPH